MCIEREYINNICIRVDIKYVYDNIIYKMFSYSYNIYIYIYKDIFFIIFLLV